MIGNIILHLHDFDPMNDWLFGLSSNHLDEVRRGLVIIIEHDGQLFAHKLHSNSMNLPYLENWAPSASFVLDHFLNSIWPNAKGNVDCFFFIRNAHVHYLFHLLLLRWFVGWFGLYDLRERFLAFGPSERGCCGFGGHVRKGFEVLNIINNLSARWLFMWMWMGAILGMASGLLPQDSVY